MTVEYRFVASDGREGKGSTPIVAIFDAVGNQLGANIVRNYKATPDDWMRLNASGEVTIRDGKKIYGTLRKEENPL